MYDFPVGTESPSISEKFTSNYPVRESFGIITSNLFNTKAIDANLIFQEKLQIIQCYSSQI